MLKISALTAIIVLGATTMSWAACPSAVPGSTAEAIKANEQRVICLQRELSDSSRVQTFELELNRLDTSLQRLELQRRFDTLPKPIPLPVPAPPKF